MDPLARRRSVPYSGRWNSGRLPLRPERTTELDTFTPAKSTRTRSTRLTAPPLSPMPPPVTGQTPVVKRFALPLFGTDGLATSSQVEQGSRIGNCYVPATVAAIAAKNPRFFTNLIATNPDGTYTVTLPGAQKSITVSDELYAADANAAYPHYGRDPSGATKWFPILEKAMAVHVGGYDKLSQLQPQSVIELLVPKTGGGLFGWGASAFTGQQGNTQQANLWSTMKAEFDSGHALIAGSTATDDMPGRGMWRNHAYSVMGFKTENGVNYLQLRNPRNALAVAEGLPAEPPAPFDGNAADGTFWVTEEQFQKDFQYWIGTRSGV
jgi:hypothetical protein